MPGAAWRRASKEPAHGVATLGCKHTRDDPYPVVQRQMLVGPLGGLYRTSLGLRRAEHQSADARVHHRPDAHEARLDGHIQRGIREPVVPESSGRIPNRHDLGVRRRILRPDGLVVPAAHDLAADDHHRPDRHFPGPGRRLGQPQGLTHERFVHGRTPDHDMKTAPR